LLPVFLDEMGVLLGLARTNARALPGDRAYDDLLKPYSKWNTSGTLGLVTPAIRALFGQY
jgi:hypothetical protein